MPKQGTARIEHRLQKEDAPVPEEEMAKRRRLAARLRAEMAEPPTELDRSLWEELKADLGMK